MTTTKPLGELVSIQGGGTPSRGKKEFWGGPIPWATVKDFKTTSLDATLESITTDGVKNSATNIIPAGSIIIPTRMAVGKAAINTIDVAINQDLKALVPTEEVDTRFLLYFLLSKNNFLKGQAQGATVKGIKLDILKSLPFPDLPRNEQRRIAAILDKAEAIRRKREQVLELADEFLKSVFLEMFFGQTANWPNATMRSVAELINGDRSSNYPSGKDIVTEGILFLSTKNIVNSRIVLSIKQFITQTKFESLSRGKLQRNDLVVTLRGSIGQCAIFDCEHETGFINAQLMILRPSKELMPTYLHRLMTHPVIQHKLNSSKSGSAIPQLTARQIGDLEIPIPPLDAQRKFTEIVEKVAGVYTRISADQIQSEALFASISQDAFAGKL